MQFMKIVILSVFAVFFVSCTKKSSTQDQVTSSQKELRIRTEELTQKPKQGIQKKEPDFSKTLREAIYFSSSLEREALKLILKDPSLQKITLFSSLAYIVEVNSGAKKTPPFGLDCGTYDIKRENNKILIFKSCVKPAPKVAEIDIVRPDESYKVNFFINEWSAIVGMSVALTGSDMNCDLGIKEKKLHKLTCQNWSYQTVEDQLSSTVLKANEFKFQRDSKKQFVITGAFYKELVENRKFDVLVPLEGKIKIIEKEVQIVDEFLEDIRQQQNPDGGTNGEESTAQSESGSQEKNNTEEGHHQNQEGSNPEGNSQEINNQESYRQENYGAESPYGESLNQQEEGFTAPGLEFQEVPAEVPSEVFDDVPVQPVPTRGRGR